MMKSAFLSIVRCEVQVKIFRLTYSENHADPQQICPFFCHAQHARCKLPGTSQDASGRGYRAALSASRDRRHPAVGDAGAHAPAGRPTPERHATQRRRGKVSVHVVHMPSFLWYGAFDKRCSLLSLGVATCTCARTCGLRHVALTHTDAVFS